LAGNIHLLFTTKVDQTLKTLKSLTSYRVTS